MEDQKYILTIQNNQFFKEIFLSPDKPDIKIGTLQECDVRLKRELFDCAILLTLCYKEGIWRLSTSGELFLRSTSEDKCVMTEIGHGDILRVISGPDGKVMFTLMMNYDLTGVTTSYDTIIDIRPCQELIIGNHSKATIKLTGKYVGKEYLCLTRTSNGRFIVNAFGARKSATLNGIRFSGTQTLAEYDFLGLADYSFYYKNGVLYSMSRKDMEIYGLTYQPLREETPAFTYPLLNRSPRMLYKFNDDPIEILDPPKKPEKPKDNLVLQLMPALLMLAVTVVTRSGIIAGLGSNNPAFLVFSLSAMMVGLCTTIISFVHNRKTYRNDLELWREDYQNYISEKRNEIIYEQGKERAALIDMYPSISSEKDFIKTFSGRIFERAPEDSDFLYLRVGLGPTRPVREVTCTSREQIKLDNDLMVIPHQLQREFSLIQQSPVLIHLRQAGSVGVVGDARERYEFFKTLLLDLCVEHSYEDVQVVILIPRDEVMKYQWVKWMPHIKESGGGFRGIVCDDESRDNVFEYIYSLMTSRLASLEAEESGPITPYIVVFALEEYAIKTHPLFQFVGRGPELGLSFVFFKEYIESLPLFCKEIVKLTPDGGELKVRDDKEFSCRFTRETVNDDSIGFAAERLAPVYVEKIALASRLTSSITLFELLNIISPEDLNLSERWKRSDVRRTLAAPLGVDAKGAHVVLDLHERAHGPHGLVAGTTGSGKSEIMQSYILSAAVNYHPHEVAFVIIDFKGGGMANQFEKLPHLVGKITDIDSREIDRSLLSIRAELEKRKRLFAEQGVNHIDQYMSAFKAGLTTVPLPHLVLIVDEFAELKAEQPEFMKELISTARVGRSLGIHLILATQKPAGQVNEQIWSNSRFKLCLKVATREDSNEVLRTPLAAEIREPGRAYLQVGNNELFTLFQSAYSGASAISDRSGNMREFSISEVSFTGRRTVIYERKAEKLGNGERLTQLKALVDYIHKYCRERGIDALPSICLPPLADVIDYKNAGQAGAVVRLGRYDDPANQVQPELSIDLSEGNVAIIGAAQTGKTIMLQTLIRGLTENNTPGAVNIYILDFASKILKMFSGLPHVGGVLTDADDERMKNFFKMMLEEIQKRKDLFAREGVGSYDAYEELSHKDMKNIPRIMIMLDNLQVFKEAFQSYEDAMLTICREGLALGITVIATAKQTSGLSYKYLSNFSTRIALNCTDSSEYSNVLDRCHIQPKNVQGRGLVSVNKTIYEFQTYLPFDGIVSETDTETVRSEAKRTEQIRRFITEINERYPGAHAREIPSMPKTLTQEYWAAQDMAFPPRVVPVGLDYAELEPVTVDLDRVGTLGIYGKERFGKSNLLRLLLGYIHQHIFDFDCECYLIDGYDRQLAEYEDCGFVRRYTVDCGDLEEIVNAFSRSAEERLDILKLGGNLDNEPLLLCVLQNLQLYAQGTVPRTVTDKLKKLMTDAKKLKICFVFSDIDNNADYSPAELMKLARDLNIYFLLDDLANVKFLGSGKIGQPELREFKKPLTLGEGYVYDARKGVQKIKLQKSKEVINHG